MDPAFLKEVNDRLGWLRALERELRHGALIEGRLAGFASTRTMAASAENMADLVPGSSISSQKASQARLKL